MKSIIYHKSSCITCRRALSEIERLKIEIEKRDFLKEPFSETELKKIIKMSGMKPREFLRKKDKKYKELELENSKHTESQLIKIMAKYPGLIKRPIIIKDGKTHVGKVEPGNLK